MFKILMEKNKILLMKQIVIKNIKSFLCHTGWFIIYFDVCKVCCLNECFQWPTILLDNHYEQKTLTYKANVFFSSKCTIFSEP